MQQPQTDRHPSFLGVVLSTHRDKDLGPDEPSYFQLEAEFAAISIFFFRTTVYLTAKRGGEPLPLKLFFSFALAALAYYKESYELIFAVEIFSYAVVPFLSSNDRKATSAKSVLYRLGSIASAATLSFAVSHLAATGRLSSLLSLVIPQFVVSGLEWIFPINELYAAYEIMEAFSNPGILRNQINHLLFVTFHIQVGMGFLGIQFLRSEQDRRNQLVRMDIGVTAEEHEADEDPGDTNENGAGGRNGKIKKKSKTKEDVMTKRSETFRKGAAPFILFTALPYMAQIIGYGNINKMAFTCLKDDLHRTIRLNELFDHDNHLIAMANDSPTSPGGMYCRSSRSAELFFAPFPAAYSNMLLLACPLTFQKRTRHRWTL